MEYPRSQWAARASLAAGFCLVQTDRAQSALQDIQWVRQQFPDTPAANEALGLNTIIYRLYLKGSAQPAYTFANRTIGGADYRDVMGVAIDSNGRVILGHKAGVSMFDARGTPIGTTNALDATAFFVDEANRVIVAKAGSLIGDRVETLYLSGPTKPIEEVGSIVATGGGDRLLIDAKTNSILRFGANGRYIGPFGSGPATRLAVNAVDDVAISIATARPSASSIGKAGRWRGCRRRAPATTSRNPWTSPSMRSATCTCSIAPRPRSSSSDRGSGC